jgi:hypothetical protein
MLPLRRCRESAAATQPSHMSIPALVNAPTGLQAVVNAACQPALILNAPTVTSAACLICVLARHPFVQTHRHRAEAQAPACGAQLS